MVHPWPEAHLFFCPRGGDISRNRVVSRREKGGRIVSGKEAATPPRLALSPTEAGAVVMV
ncbi:MAG: hypothetical protein RBR34_07770 [Rhodospirillaceae bacterium]|nr:hypothetical protein [Rhodospirillaceae bacterium]